MTFSIDDQTKKPLDLSVERAKNNFDQLPDSASISQLNKRLYKFVNEHVNSGEQIQPSTLPIRVLEAANDFTCFKMDILDKYLQFYQDMVNRPYQPDEHKKIFLKSFQNPQQAILIAAKNGGVDLIEKLIQAKANVNQMDDNGATPLIIAVANSYVDVIQKLIQHGADVNPANSNGITPLMLAAMIGYVDIIETLIKMELMSI